MEAKAQLESVLERVAKKEDIAIYQVVPDHDILRGDGFLSEFHTGSIKNKATGEELKVYVKFQPVYNPGLSIPDIYSNELKFYSQLWPALNAFQTERGVAVPFDKVPKFFVGDAKSDRRYIALENLKAQHYILHDKAKCLNEEHLKTLFETYGKFHAITFAFKDQLPEKHDELVIPLKDIFSQFANVDHFEEMLIRIVQVAFETIRETDEESAKKLELLIKNFHEYSTKANTYEGEYSALTHGDCWSNNMLFKYDKQGHLENLKLLDFQLVRNSTPIHDLSYFFYSGASKEDFDRLNDYLDIYHKSFSNFASELGSDPHKLLPLEALKAEWKRYSFLGLTMGLMVWQIKFVEKSSIENMADDAEPNQEKWKDMVKLVMEMPQFRKNVSDIMLHAVEYGIL